MLHRLHRAGLILPTVLSFIGLCVLLGLGAWQMKRMVWKDGLVAKITERSGQSPVSFEEALKRFQENQEDVDYLPVTVTGRMVHEGEMYFYAPDPKRGPGVHVYTPLQYAPDRVVWLNRGFVSKADIAREARADGLPEGELTVTGLARLAPSDKGSVFTPENDLVKRQFYWRDLNNMHAVAFDKLRVTAAPFFVEVSKDGQPYSSKGPFGGVTRLRLSNRHLEYTLTWFGLAATLLGVFVVFARGRLRTVQNGPNSGDATVT